VGELAESIERWRNRGDRIALATVVATRRSAPRPVGAKLIVSERGELFGSVSGGCVENDVAVQAAEVIEDGKPRLLTYGISDDQAWNVGLPCGGEIDVFVEPFAKAPGIERGTSYVVVAGDGVGERWHDESTNRTTLREEDGRTVFVERVAPPPRLVAVGAGVAMVLRPILTRTIVRLFPFRIPDENVEPVETTIGSAFSVPHLQASEKRTPQRQRGVLAARPQQRVAAQAGSERIRASTRVPAGIPSSPAGTRTSALAPVSEASREEDCEPVERATRSAPSRLRVTR